ncbi:MAG: GNAT family N-acetyltransferase, partial [Pseudomonadota bacterium]
AEDIVGFVSITLDHTTLLGEIGLNAVHPSQCGRGYGTQLYTHALDVMRQAGMKAASVGTGADPSHAPARRAYQKAGFGPTLPNQWMYRTL